MESSPRPDFRIVFRAASLLNSSLDRDVVLRECAEIELAAILAKPFDPVELANQVRSLIMQPL